MISAEKHVAPSHREATTKACEQANHEELSQNWRHVRTPMLRGSAAQAPRPASLAGKGGRAGACHDARGMRRGQLTNALLGRVGEVAITVSSSTFRRRNGVASWPSGPARNRPRSQNHNQ